MKLRQAEAWRQSRSSALPDEDEFYAAQDSSFWQGYVWDFGIGCACHVCQLQERAYVSVGPGYRAIPNSIGASIDPVNDADSGARHQVPGHCSAPFGYRAVDRIVECVFAEQDRASGINSMQRRETAVRSAGPPLVRTLSRLPLQ